MSTAAGDNWQWPYPAPYWQWPPPYFGPYKTTTTDNTGCRIYEPPTEDRIREIIREELAAALSKLKEHGT